MKKSLLQSVGAILAAGRYILWLASGPKQGMEVLATFSLASKEILVR